MAPAKQSWSSYSSQDAVNSDIVTVGRSSMLPVRSLFAPVSSISTDNCKTRRAGSVTPVSALIKYALDRRPSSTYGTTLLGRGTHLEATDQRAGVEYVSTRQGDATHRRELTADD